MTPDLFLLHSFFLGSSLDNFPDQSSNSLILSQAFKLVLWVFNFYYLILFFRSSIWFFQIDLLFSFSTFLFLGHYQSSTIGNQMLTLRFFRSSKNSECRLQTDTRANLFMLMNSLEQFNFFLFCLAKFKRGNFFCSLQVYFFVHS